jgi:hypothetical protein
MSLREVLFLLKLSKNLRMSFEAMTRLAEGLCLSALLTLEVENSFVLVIKVLAYLTITNIISNISPS